MNINQSQRQALQYIANTKGAATEAMFLEDHEPIGRALLNDLYDNDWIRYDLNGHLNLSATGSVALANI